MTNRWKQWTASILMLAFFLTWVYAAVLPWRVAEVASAVRNRRAGAVAVFRLPWAEDAARFEARRLMAPMRTDAWLADKLLRYSAGGRILYAPTWLDRAELALRQGDAEAAGRYAEIAQELWPRRERILWRLAMFSLRRGEDERTLQLLRRYLVVRHNDVGRAATIARRVERNPGKLIASLLPGHESPGREAGYYHAQLLSFAVRYRDIELAREVWSSLPVEVRQKAATAFGYIDLLISVDRPDLAVSAWRDFTGGGGIGGGLYNPDFERELAQGGLGWRAREVKGVRWERDGEIKHNGSYSLHLAFDGKENVHYRHVSQVMALEPGRRYRLSGYWRGKALSTRSGPYLEMYSQGGAKNVHVQTEKRRKSWEWEPFELVLSMPRDASFAGLRVRRDRTNALDRLIEGELWVDELSLALVAESDFDGEN